MIITYSDILFFFKINNAFIPKIPPVTLFATSFTVVKFFFNNH